MCTSNACSEEKAYQKQKGPDGQGREVLFYMPSRHIFSTMSPVRVNLSLGLGVGNSGSKAYYSSNAFYLKVTRVKLKPAFLWAALAMSLPAVVRCGAGRHSLGRTAWKAKQGGLGDRIWLMGQRLPVPELNSEFF